MKKLFLSFLVMGLMIVAPTSSTASSKAVVSVQCSKTEKKITPEVVTQTLVNALKLNKKQAKQLLKLNKKYAKYIADPRFVGLPMNRSCAGKMKQMGSCGNGHCKQGVAKDCCKDAKGCEKQQGNCGKQQGKGCCKEAKGCDKQQGSCGKQQGKSCCKEAKGCEKQQGSCNKEQGKSCCKEAKGCDKQQGSCGKQQGKGCCKEAKGCDKQNEKCQNCDTTKEHKFREKMLPQKYGIDSNAANDIKKSMEFKEKNAQYKAYHAALQKILTAEQYDKMLSF